MRAKILSASAGSGKTYRLAYKFVHDTIKHFTSKPYLYRAILAVTFTNKATEQMKSRILKEINCLATNIDNSSYLGDLQRDLGLDKSEITKRAKIIRTRILHDYSHFMVLTIDKFFQRIFCDRVFGHVKYVKRQLFHRIICILQEFRQRQPW